MPQDLNNIDSTSHLSQEVRLFAAGLAHAMANVVGSLQMNIELSRMYATRNDLERAMVPLQRLADDCAKANKVVGDLQRLAGSLSNTKVVPMPLASVVNMALDAARGKMDSAAAPGVEMHVSAHPAEIDANSQVVLIELLRNALQSGASTVLVTAKVTETETSINIEDDGSGMDAQTAKKIFEPFFTTRRELGHSGMGLTISKYLSNRLGGSLSVLANTDKGVKVILTLPRVDVPS